jgi:hypothetical protein
VLRDLTEISESGFHQLWLQTQHKKLKSFLLCVCYRPPVVLYLVSPIISWTIISKHSLFGKDIIIAGDLRLLHMMNVRFSLLNMAQRILGVTLPNF